MNTIEKHIDLIATNDYEMLLAPQDGLCISLYMPTYQHGADEQQNPIRFKNLVTELRDKLAARGMRSPEIEALLRPMDADSTLKAWEYMSDGLMIFIGPGLYRSYRIPIQFEPFAYLGENFHIRQLLPALTADMHFYILTLNQANARLLRANRYQIGEVDLGDVPQSLAEVLKYDEFQKSLQSHSTTRQVGGGTDSIFHGQGGGDDAQNEHLTRFFKALDNGVCDYLNDSERPMPLILAGTDELRGLYRQVNHYNGLADTDITSAPQSLSDNVLHERARDLLEPTFKRAVNAATDRFRQLGGSADPRAVTDLKKIVAAALYQRIETLFLPDAVDTYRWGRFDPQQDALITHDSYQNGDHDLLNDATLNTLRNGGGIYPLAAGTLNELSGTGPVAAAAILRY